MYRVQLCIVPEESGNCRDMRITKNPTQTMNVHQVFIILII